MKKIFLLLLFVLFLQQFVFAQNSINNGINIIPEPVKIINKPGEFTVDCHTLIVNHDKNNSINNYLLDKLKHSTDWNLIITDIQPADNSIVLSIDSTLNYNPEGYYLAVTVKSVLIQAKTSTGLFYGIQSFFQLLPPEIENQPVIMTTSWKIPCVEIFDYPRFTYRGVLLDVSRHFFSVDFIKKQLDIMAMYKLNVFHWHLTDDQGWRIEIKKYPKLTEVGSKRSEFDGSFYGGYYTQEQIKDIVAYAKARFINILPEIDMPGHSMAALAAYPDISCTGGPFEVPSIWGSHKDALCPGKEKTFTFINDIMDEVSNLFPYAYVHIGCDECSKDRWMVCPYCRSRIKTEGLKNMKQLQSYFVKRVEKIVNAHGKRIIGWQEILEGGLAPGATVMSWQDEKGGINAALEHHQVIMCPQKWLYLDHYQGSDKVEPVALNGLVSLEDIYTYNPVPAKIDTSCQRYIKGVQANIWSEYLYSPDKVEYIAYPRMLALAEISWTFNENKDYSNFIERLNNQFPRLDYHDIHYHIPLPEGPAYKEAFTDTLNLSFSTSRPVKMIYTVDNTEPIMNYSIYTRPININKNTIIKIRSVLPSGEMSNVRTITAIKQNYEPSVTVNSKPGLYVHTCYGMFISVKDLDTVKMCSETIINNLKTRYNYHNPSGSIIEGYIDIPSTGIYYFSTNLEEYWINGKLLINNGGEVKNHSRKDASIALLKGKHKVKLIFLNNIVGGRPASVNGIRIFYRKKNDPDFKLVDASMLSH